MDKEVCYRVREGFVHRKVADNDVLISIGANVANFNGYITLNPTASFLWDALNTPQSVSTLIQLLTDEFDVSRETAQKDVQFFVEMLLRNEMITPYEET